MPPTDPNKNDKNEGKQKMGIADEIFRSVGPGFITGAADDDPSGIATYSQTGTLFGFAQLWLVLFSYPFMVAVQEMCGRIGLVTGKGLSGVIKEHYSRKVLLGAVLLLIIANTINIGADLGAMAQALGLIVKAPFILWLLFVTFLTLLLEILVSYPSYVKFLKYLTLSLLAYVITAFLVKPNWSLIAYSTLVPHFSLTKVFLVNVAAFLGTTISPYLFFWQADEEVEEEIVDHKIRAIGLGIPKIKPRDIRHMRVDTFSGMLFSNVITFFIVITAAATLGAHGLGEIQTAAQAAGALEPLAGHFAFLLFALGIVGTGLIAVPVLAGSAGYALAEAMHWEAGLSKKFNQAHGFYLVIALSTLVGLLINFTSIGSITMLYYSAVINGVLAPPLLILILLISNNKKILGDHTNGPLANILGIIITLAMGAVALSLLF